MTSEKRFGLVTIAVVLMCLDARGNDRVPPFYADDPIQREPESQDASTVRPWGLSDTFDGVRSSLGSPGERVDKRALNVNTLDEVPDSSWFTNRIGTRDIPVDELVRNANRGSGPAAGGLTIVEAKSAGIQPGFVVTDATGQRYFIKFDPPSNPEMASGAEVISTRFFHAFGYHVPENFIGRIRREALVIGEGAITRRHGRKYPFTTRDLDDILERAAQSADGSYRFMASRELAGQAIGPFRYSGTRPDDPNDIFLHEHRRELRGLRVIAAWLNHHDVRSNNSLDTLVDVEGRKLVRHHLLDFGATLGSGSIEAQKRQAGNEHVWESRPTMITMLTLGLYVRPWLKIDYPDIPAVGRIESSYFMPVDWKPDFPNPAFQNARADDTFWAARRVAAFSDEIIRAVVKTAEFTDKRADDYLNHVLIERRDKVLQAWLTGINPLVEFALDDRGVLTFRNAAVDARIATPPSQYRSRWAKFDNATGTIDAFTAEATSPDPKFQAPPELGGGGADFLVAEVATTHADHASWARPVRVYFRRTGSAWKTIGLERIPESPAPAAESSGK